MQMNAGVHVTRGDILLLLHVDMELPPDAVTQIEKATEGPQVVGGGFRKRHREAPPLLVLQDWWLNTLRSGLQRHLVGTNGIFVRRSVFEHLGGFREWSLLEDVEFPDRLRDLGRVAFLTGPVLVSARKYLRHRTLRQRLTNARVMAGYGWLGIHPEQLASICGA